MLYVRINKYFLLKNVSVIVAVTNVLQNKFDHYKFAPKRNVNDYINTQIMMYACFIK